MKNIKNSPFSLYFEEIIEDDIFLLDKAESESKWSYLIDNDKPSYFKLDDDNWLLKSKSLWGANWVEDFNKNFLSDVNAILNNNINWKNSDSVLFLINKFFVITSSWSTFKYNWISFLECENDCPILINEKYPNQAILFKPRGDFEFLKHSNNG